jgi:hypothetical protein
MQCSVCRGASFVASEYKMEGVMAPALECTYCHALNLDETVARSQEDLDSVRMAVAARAASSCHDGPKTPSRAAQRRARDHFPHFSHQRITASSEKRLLAVLRTLYRGATARSQ